MDKKRKPQRRKTPDAEELKELTPRGASFDTEEGREAQGMRPDIGGEGEGEGDQFKKEDSEEDRKETLPDNRTKPN